MFKCQALTLLHSIFLWGLVELQSKQKQKNFKRIEPSTNFSISNIVWNFDILGHKSICFQDFILKEKSEKSANYCWLGVVQIHSKVWVLVIYKFKWIWLHSFLFFLVVNLNIHLIWVHRKSNILMNIALFQP